MTAAFLALAWLIGIAATSFAGAGVAPSLAAASLLAAVSFAVLPRPQTLALIVLGSTLIFVAGWRYEATLPELAPDSIGHLNDGAEVRFRALVDDEPQERETSRVYRLEVREAFENGRWRERTGAVLMRAPLHSTHEYGDLLEVRGELETPPQLEDFDYREYLLRRGITSIASYPRTRTLATSEGDSFHEVLFDARANISGALQDALPEPEASLASGILLGARGGLPADLRDDMRSTGTTHLVAVSGQNVTILAALVIAVLAWLIGRRPACWTALVVLVGYAVLVGGQPSVVRAAIMGALYVISVALGRQNTGFIALGLAAAVMTALDPQIVHDVGFQLSFASTLGLVILTPLLNDAIARLRERWPVALEAPGARLLADVLVMSVAAIALTLPITAINFHEISLSAPLANLFAVPAFVAVAGTSALVAVAGIALPGDAGWLGWLAWLPSAYMLAVIRLFASFPLASLELTGVHTPHAIAYYAALALLLTYLYRRRVSLPPLAKLSPAPAPRYAIPAPAIAAVLAVAAGVVWLSASAGEGNRLSVTFLDVGQGDAILVEGPEGHRILVDGGPSGASVRAALDRHLPFYDRRIDLVVLTHPQTDHLGGLPTVVQRYDVGGVLSPGVRTRTDLYAEWREALAEDGVREVTAVRGQQIDLGRGCWLWVLSPIPGHELEGLNDNSVVLRLTMGDVSVLLTGDIGVDAERALISRGTDLSATVLKVAHHGSRSSTGEEFLRRANPALDVISVGERNRYGHPTEEVLGRLSGDAVYRTDERGDITVSTDGEHLWVETQH